MKKNVKLKLWSFFGVFLASALFISFSYFIQTRLEIFDSAIMGGGFGMVVYFLLNVLAVVLAPITVLPLIVLAVGFWGIWIAVILTVFAWTLGSVIAFLLARRFGVPIVRRFVSLENIYKFEERVKIGSGFWNVVFLRMILPVDVLSYALGLFSRIGFWTYALATFIGVIPFAFVFAYLGEVPYFYQVIAGLVFLIVFLGYLIFRELKLVSAK
jgi:uncharacterized membrane protein YdjX (TVP38/TMEM64 family)